MFGIRDRTLSGKLIRFLTMLASALTVALAGDRSVATTGCADLARCQYKIDVSQHVVDAVGVMFDAASVHHHAGLCAPVQPSSVHDLLCRHTADLRRNVRRIARGEFARWLPIVGA